MRGNTGFKVRKANPSEFVEIGEITVQAYLAVPGLMDGDREFYLDELRNVSGRAETSDILVAVQATEQIMGVVAYVPDTTSEMAEWDMPEVAGFRMLAVSPKAQGRGVGRLLTQACIDRARQAGRKAIVLHTTEQMTTAQSLYGKMGFQRDVSFDKDLGFLLLMGYRLDF